MDAAEARQIAQIVHAAVIDVRPSLATRVLDALLPMRYWPHHGLAIVVGVAIGLTTFDAQAQGGADAVRKAPSKQTAGMSKGKSTQFARLDAILSGLVGQFERSDHSPKAEHDVARQAPMRRGSMVAVTFRVRAAASGVALGQWLRDNNAEPRNFGVDYVEAYVPVALLSAAAKRPEVFRAQAIFPPLPKRGRVTSEGVAAHRAQRWHAAGWRGQGVKVGVIDGGFQDLSALRGSELPDHIVGRCYESIGEMATGEFTSALAVCENGETHGTAVAEALLDIAPDATLYIANPISNADLQATVDWMIAEGVKVVNHSIGIAWDGPGDGTSPDSESPLNTVDRAVGGHIFWANAAGNERESAWLGAFKDSNADGFHEFGGGEDCNRVEIPPGGFLYAQLRWQGEWGGDAPLADLDLHLYEVVSGTYDPNSPVVSSTINQNDLSPERPGFRVPNEILFFQSPGGEYCLTAETFTGYGYATPQPGWIQLIDHVGSPLRWNRGGSIGNPAESANPGMLAVGAANWRTATEIEDYSSRGPTPDGRVKPDVVGVDQGTSITFGPAASETAFAGTSQASPHIAGLAALVAGRWPRFTAIEIANYLRYHAFRATGADPNAWGSGLARLPPPAVVNRTLASGNNLALPLAAMFPDFTGSVAYAARSSHPEAVRVAVQGRRLQIAVPDDAAPDVVVTVTVTATQGGRSDTVRFQVAVPAIQRSILWRLLPLIAEPDA